MKTKICYFSTNDLLTPIPHLRLLGPSRIEDLELHLINNDDLLSEKAISGSQILIIDRDAPREYHSFKEIVRLANISEIPIVYDIDDYLLDLPINHPDREAFIYTQSLLPIFEALLLADYVTVSTEKLRETLKIFNRNIFVLPNFLDDTLWPFHLPIQRRSSKQITIGYMGGKSHKPDIEWITPVLENIQKSYSEVINFHFYGVQPPDKILANKNVTHTDVLTYNYKEFINNFHNLGVDLFIAPLIDNLFNQCKSPLKFFEYSALGVPAVFSDVEPYRNVIVDGKNGFLAKSQEDWVDKIRALIDNPDLRYHIAKNAQETVRSKFLMSENAHLWTETFNKFIQLGPQKNTNNNWLESIAAISLQLHEYHQYQKTTINEKEVLDNVLEDKGKLIEDQKGKLGQQERLIQSISEDLHNQEQKNQNLKKVISEQDASIRLLNENIKNIKSSNKSFSLRLLEMEGLVQSLKDELSKKDRELLSTNFQLKEKAQAISSLRNEIDSRNKEISGITIKLEDSGNVVNDLNSQIQKKNNELNNLQAKITELKNEILFYSLSKSWQLTRPLRKIMSLFKGRKDA